MQAHESERVEGGAAGIRAGWLAGAIVAGFAATMVMLLAFVVAFSLARLLSGVPFGELWGSELVRREFGRQGVRGADVPLVTIPGGELLRLWLYNLTHNRLIDLISTDLYIAVAIYLAGGLVWAVVYAALAEPRLTGPAWRRGAVFSIVPGILSVVVFLPLVGAGMLGSALGAGPLPVIGNLLLHLVYGITLGQLYGPFGDRDATTLEGPLASAAAAAMGASDRMLARGLLIGLGLGTALGIAVTFAAGLRPDDRLLAIPVAALLLASALLGAALGAVIGSFVGLSGSRDAPG